MWDDNRVFETARKANIVQLLKIIVDHPLIPICIEEVIRAAATSRCGPGHAQEYSGVTRAT